MARRIKAEHLRGLPGVRPSALAELVRRQPRTVREALKLPDVGRKTTGRLLELGLITDPDGVQAGTASTNEPSVLLAEAMRDWLRKKADLLAQSQRAMGARYHSAERFVLDLGRPYASKALTAAEAVVVNKAIDDCRFATGPFELKACFTNAQRLVLEDRSGRLSYVEGYVHTNRIVVPHGWAAIGAKVIDVTVPENAPAADESDDDEPGRILGEFNNRGYFGVPFVTAYVAQHAEVTDGPGSLIDDWEHGWPLLQNGGAGAVQQVTSK